MLIFCPSPSFIFRAHCRFSSRILLDVRKPPTGKVDSASPYVAFSRATKLEDVFLLFPVTIRDLNRPRDADVVALIECLQRLDRKTLEIFTEEWWTFAPATASLLVESDDEDGNIDDDHVPGGRKGKGKGKRGSSRQTPGGSAFGRHGNGDTNITIPAVRLMPNKDNNCFFNSAVALVVAAFDNQPLPPSLECTPAAAAFFAAVEVARDAMFTTEPLQNYVLVRACGKTCTKPHHNSILNQCSFRLPFW